MSTITTKIRSTQFTLALTGVVPAVCDAEAGEAGRQSTDAPLGELALGYDLADQSYLTRLFRMIARHLRRPKSRSRGSVQTCAQFFKNRTAVSPKLSASPIH